MKIYPSNEKPYIYTVNNDDVIVQVNSDILNKSYRHNPNTFETFFSHSIIGQSIWSYIESIEVQKLYRILLNSVRKYKTSVQIPFRSDSCEQRRFLQLKVSALKDNLVEFKSEIICFENREKMPLLDESAKRNDEYITMCSMCKSIRFDDSTWMEAEAYFQTDTNKRLEACPKVFHSICSNCFESVLDEVEKIEK